MENRHSLFKRSLVIYFVIVAVVLSFVGGYALGQHQGIVSIIERTPGEVSNKEIIPEHLSKDVDFKMFWEVWDLVKLKHLKQPINEVEMFYGAMMGMVASLGDPYTVFFEPETAEKFAEDLAGTFSGIGAEIAIKSGQLVIVSPLPDSPAEKAGLRAGDKIMAIGDLDTRGITIDEAINLIRGPKGTSVKLMVARDGLDTIKEYMIIRDQIIVKSVKLDWKDGNIAVLEISQFGDDTVYEFQRRVGEILKKDVKGLIIDLRGNPGGYLDAAISIAGEWIAEDVVVCERNAVGAVQEFYANGRGLLTDIPTVVLINQGSASGSEIVAGALQDHKKATLVGMTSFGKGSVQDYEELRDGSAVKITIAEWLTPNKRAINEIGVKPDVEVDLTEEDFNASKDPQMEKALEILKK
jgi:carboxyl-terminal processing protease